MNKLTNKSRDIFGRFHFIIGPLLLALLSALGVTEYDKRQDPPAVTVNVESMPAQFGRPDILSICRREIARHKTEYH